MMTAEHMATTSFGKLRMKNPADLMPGSRTKIAWICDCGNETLVQPLSVSTGHTSSCGRCNELSEQHFATTKYGKLRMVEPITVLPGSSVEVLWSCDCGGSISRSPYMVISGHTSSCGKCRHSDPEYWAKPSYGRLTSRGTIGLSAGSNKRIWWDCLCGNRTEQEVYTVSSGKVVSCGQCMDVAREWHSKNKNVFLAMKCPVRPDEFPGGWLYPLETITGVEIPFRALCGSCKNEYAPRISNLRRGSSLTCGCTTNRTSAAAVAIADFVRSLGLDAVLEHPVSGLKYDVFIPSANLLVEHNGLRWHSMPGSKARDVEKYRTALGSGFSYLMVFEDEWSRSRHKVESLLRNRLVRSSPVSLRPSACSTRPVSSKEASPFYDAHHYIGSCNARAHYGVHHGGALVACASFSVPSRQSRHPWELVRMASHPSFRVHGIWSKVFSTFVREHSPSSVVSFSDNRLFPGRVYEKMGFRLDGEVRPDYFWARGDRRFHKSGLRKRGLERESGLTEGQLRESEGYKRVWDLGKTRWTWSPAATPT